MRSRGRRLVVAFLSATLVVGGFILHQEPARAAGEFVFATGAGPGGGPHVKLFTADGAQERTSFYAYDGAFRGGVEVALGDLDGDGSDEIITAPGAGGGPDIRVFTLAGVPIDKWRFLAYDPNFTGGVHIGIADVNGDGDAEIVTAPGAGGGPHVKVWDIVGDKPTLISQRMAYDTSFHGGVFVAGAYTNADSDNQSIITGAGTGGGPHVKVLSPDLGSETDSFLAYDPAYHGGVSVGAWDEDGDGVDEIVTGALQGRGHVRSFAMNAGATGGDVSFYAFDAKVGAGAQMATIDGDANGPFLVAPYNAGLGPCSIDDDPANCVRRADYVMGFDEGGVQSIQAAPYGSGWTGGIRVAGGFGVPPVIPPPTTTSTSTTSTSTTSTTSTTVPPTTTSSVP